MAPRVFNTLSRGKEALAPVHAGEVRIYVCGEIGRASCRERVSYSV